MRLYNYKIGNNIKARDEKMKVSLSVEYKAICNDNNKFHKKIRPFKYSCDSVLITNLFLPEMIGA